MRIVGIANLVMALVWVPIAIFAPYEGDGLVRHAQVFNAVASSAVTVVWIALEAARYRAQKRSSQHQVGSPPEEKASP
ncbi:hypothetical protein [Nocardiopsis sp. M1B1]|uniref:hypothetical protein n=1 Tax=Nocardiopsis sp. M1B1 TaxID=3450454 RepID=UPI0040397D7E